MGGRHVPDSDGMLGVRIRSDGCYVCVACRRYEARTPGEMTEHAWRRHGAKGWTAREGSGERRARL